MCIYMFIYIRDGAMVYIYTYNMYKGDKCPVYGHKYIYSV